MQLFSFDAWSEREGDARLGAAWCESAAIVDAMRDQPLLARCALCGPGNGQIVTRTDPGGTVNVREGLHCTGCGGNARVRAALGLLKQRLGTRLPTRPRVYITEQVTRTYAWLQRNLDADLHGSEFEPGAWRRFVLRQRLRRLGGSGAVDFQDITRLSFDSASMDAVVSFDVLEHVPAFSTAIGEFARVLRPGGTCIATFPFTDGPATVIRAAWQDGSLVHLLEPEYHGDPIGGGILCYQHFGWDVLDAFRDAGFRKAGMCMPFAPEQGLLFGLWTLVAER